MRCKLDDIARFVGSGGPDRTCRNDGCIVICRELLGMITDQLGTHLCWRVEPALRTKDDRPTDICPDEWLRPLRGTSQPDETLTYVGRPQRTTA